MNAEETGHLRCAFLTGRNQVEGSFRLCFRELWRTTAFVRARQSASRGVELGNRATSRRRLRPWREDGVRAEVGRVAYRAGRTGHQLPDGSGSTADEERLDDGTWTKGSFA
jgi:hypothetical protein